MTVIYINVGATVNQASAPWTNNFFTSANGQTVGVIKADLLDDVGAATGIGFANLTAYDGTAGTGTVATVGAGSWPEAVFDRSWSGNGSSRLTGLVNGSGFTIEVAGHNSGDATESTDFTINGVTTTYENSGTTIPNAPITFTGIISGTTLDLTPSAGGNTNGFKITITPPSSRSITNIDTDNNVQAGQTNITVTTVGMDVSPTIKTATLGGESLTVVSAGETSWTVSVPLHIDLEWDSATNDLVLTDDTGSVTLNNVTLSTPTGWETVTFTSAPDVGTTESFYELSQTDATVGNFTAATGDILAFESQTGLTVDGQTIPVVDPPLTVAGAYKWWDVSLATWTDVSSFTINDLGLFGSSASNRILRPVIRSILRSVIRPILEDKS